MMATSRNKGKEMEDNRNLEGNSFSNKIITTNQAKKCII
jgi:hypothetical protein